ncbi:hypothetical protein CTP10_R66870 (plasmid) [Cupriavidus sp. P-10]|uniref:glycine-rich domain-containing protein n=1 Tax=Cupriavidus sp. P-10 TaxID=2027911 RepID=UPI000E2E7785|nr:hypothetical protein [Cupriavidus sp. P-10]BDB29273.1 hypothetical protein CTP10_R66870 [Cupriavidus sp. P-10]
MQDRTVQSMWEAIDTLNFSRMKAKLLHQQHRDWTMESLEEAEGGYRQFLKLAAKYPETPAVPSELVDAFWHAHILDTRRYADDCVRIFGYILHHDPYVGIDGPEDEARLMAMAATSDALNMREFGSPLTSSAYCARAATDNAAYCARMAKETNAAYCARMAERQDAAYCARLAGTDDLVSQGRALAPRPAYCALTSPRTVAC